MSTQLTLCDIIVELNKCDKYKDDRHLKLHAAHGVLQLSTQQLYAGFSIDDLITEYEVFVIDSDVYMQNEQALVVDKLLGVLGANTRVPADDRAELISHVKHEYTIDGNRRLIRKDGSNEDTDAFLTSMYQCLVCCMYLHHFKTSCKLINRTTKITENHGTNVCDLIDVQ